MQRKVTLLITITYEFLHRIEVKGCLFAVIEFPAREFHLNAS